MKKEKIKIEIIKGSEGNCLSIDGYRFAGSKPWGGGTVIQEWIVNKDDFVKSLQHIGVN